MREAASPAKLKRVLENMPKEGLVDVFTFFIRLCLKRKVFGARPLHEIVKTIELQATGKYTPAPNQSPMPRTRPENMADASAAAKALIVEESKG